MSKRIYVGNLPYRTTADDLRRIFEDYGTVLSVNLVNDRETGQPRGFGFVEMNDAEADAAVEALNNTMVGGRSIKVNEARPRPERRSG
ncbi:MAG: RNA-binding protein [Thermoanaerobaculia bacterium]